MTHIKHTPGLTYRKMDLHVHTPASRDFTNKTVTPAQLIRSAIDKGLDAIAVTDHNSGGWIDQIVEAAKGTDLTVFPGVELTCSGGTGGVHIVALFEQGTSKALVEHLLSKLDVLPENRGDLNFVITRSVIDTVREIRQAGGLAVLAHANSGSGALSDIRGQERISIVKDKNLNAVEATDMLDTVKAAAKRRLVDLLDGRDATYGNRILAAYQASDNPDAEGESRHGHGLDGIAARVTYFKVDSINLEALRQCFSDPKVRISFNPLPVTSPRIVGIAVEGGYFDKKSTTFHSGLNSILGGKGAGKSLLIELLRFGLNQPSTVEPVLKDHRTKLQKRLDNYGRVTIDVVDTDGVERQIIRSYIPSEDNPYETAEMAKYAEGFPVLFLSQNEIISVAEDPKAQLVFIDNFFNFKHHQLIIADYENQLSEWDARMANSIRASEELKDVKSLQFSTSKELIDLDTKLENPIFSQLKTEEAKRQYLEDRDLELDGMLETIARDLEDENLFVFDQEDLAEEVSSDPLVKRLSDIEKSSKDKIKDQLNEIVQTITTARQEIDAERTKFSPLYANAKSKYDEQVRQAGGDDKALAEKRAIKAKELTDLIARYKRLDLKSKDLRTIAANRKLILEKLNTAYEDYAKERKTRVKAIEATSSGKLRLDITAGENRDAFTDKLRSLKKGSYLKDFEVEQITKNIEPFTFINNVFYYLMTAEAKYVEEIASKVGLDTERIKLLTDFLINGYQYEELLELQYKVMPEDTPQIEYNISDDPTVPVYRKLDELSTGQKCTAMLIIALSDGCQPIIIDQPEDSLDIKSVWIDMCKRLRIDKNNRQFVFTTHNSSLAVASDTDRYLIVEGGAASGMFVSAGSMDEPGMNNEVIKYLEGDLAAYNLKAEKYNLKG